MKIELEIPNWAGRENLYVISRTELVAYKMVDDKWVVKSSRCNKCGNCCLVHPKEGAYFPLNPDGSCIHLVKDGDKKVCKLGMEKPLACVLGEPEGQEHKKFKCSIKYRRK